MTQFKTFTEDERTALKLHGFDTHQPSQLADAFVLGLRYKSEVTEKPNLNDLLKVQRGPFKGKPQVWFTRAEVITFLAWATTDPAPVEQESLPLAACLLIQRMAEHKCMRCDCGIAAEDWEILTKMATTCGTGCNCLMQCGDWYAHNGRPFPPGRPNRPG